MTVPSADHAIGLTLLLLMVITALGARAPELPWRAPRPGHARARRVFTAVLVCVGAIGVGAHVRLLTAGRAIRLAIADYQGTPDRRASFLRRSAVTTPLRDCTDDASESLSAPTLLWSADAIEPTVRSMPRAPWPEQELLGTSADGVAPFALSVLFGTTRVAPAASLWSPNTSLRPIRTTLCRKAMLRTQELLERTGLHATVLVAQVGTGRVLVWSESRGLAAVDTLRRLLAEEVRPIGSVSKLHLAAAAAVTTGWEVDLPCPETLRLDGRDLHNAKNEHYAHGDVLKMLRLSCNTAAAGLIDRIVRQVGADSVARLYTQMGIAPSNAASLTSRDTAAWSSATARVSRALAPPVATMSLDRNTTAFSRAMLAIGQGSLRATPIDVLRWTSVIANDGRMVPLTLEWARGDSTASRQVIPPRVARRLRNAMRIVVTEGTAQRLHHGATETLPQGFVFTAKTGTPQRTVRVAEGTAKTSADQPAAPNATWRRTEDGLIAAIVCESELCARPPIVVVVYMENAGAGGSMPAIVADSVAAYVLSNYGAVLNAVAVHDRPITSPATGKSSVGPLPGGRP